MKRMITLLLALAICFGLMPVAAFAQAMPFTDVADDAFYYDAVAWAVEEEITTGMTPTTFGPDAKCTRGHVVTFLWRLAGCPKPQGDTMPFVDVELNEYYTDAILWAVEQGITEGRDDTHFDPLAECSRAEIAVFLWRFFGSQSVEGLTNPFTDVVSGEWYTSAIVWAAARAIADGMPDQTFAFADTCTRGQVVTFLYRAAKLMEELEEPTEPSEEATEPSEGDEPGLKLEEDASTVNRGDMLRASTYALTSANDGTSTQATTTKTLKYFDVTLFDYDTKITYANPDVVSGAFNDATHALDLAEDPDAETWNGLYFNTGSPGSESYSYATDSTARTDLTWADVMNGTYYSDEACTIKATVSAVMDSTGSGEYEKVSVARSELISVTTDTWIRCEGYYYQIDGEYYPLYAKRYNYYDYTYYFIYNWGYSKTNSENDVTAIQVSNYYGANDYNYDYSTSYTFNIYKMEGTVVGYTLTAGGTTLKTLNGTDTSAAIGVTLYQVGAKEETEAKSYAAYNWWNKGSGKAEDGQKFYTGLVEDTLVNGNIRFTVPEAGFFNNDTTVKTIYERVEMPFVYEDGFYSFYSHEDGVYFKEDSTQGSTTAKSDGRLYFDDNPQQIKDSGSSSGYKSWGDGSENVWLPFNETQVLSGFTEADYHFGMVATIPFTMTTNGKINASDNTSQDIIFSFSGDDDVWVFIDGQLVIDLGGIHNRLDAEINFADGDYGTVTYSVSNSKKDEQPTGSFNEGDGFSLNQQLFGNLIGQNRETFAATEDHTLTIFYLERGAGSSNCRIRFNLPMKDNVTVTKVVNESKTEGGKTSPLTAEEKTYVDSLNYGFTLYRGTDGNNFAAVANANYLLLNENKTVLGVYATDSNGHFTLKNGQTAKFITDFSTNTYYYVREDELTDQGFYEPSYSYTGSATNAYSYRIGDTGSYTTLTGDGSTDASTIPTTSGSYTSNYICVSGSAEATDNLAFYCYNYVKSDIPNPTVITNDVMYVIDYGLPVDLTDILTNDRIKGDNINVQFFHGTGVTLANGTLKTDGSVDTEPTADTSKLSTLKYGEFVDNGDNTLTYTLNKQMTGVEVIDYMVTASASGTSAGQDTTLYAAAIGHIYIIPATTMYYEEYFTGLVEYGSGWTEETTTGHSDRQETGLVDSTMNWSPYGSDVAYQDDDKDSNGTSKYVDTTNGSATFSYTFTGTASSFFARTTKDTGYLKIELKDSDGTTVELKYRDTAWLQDASEAHANDTLYNIPVYTTPDLSYGTYTVTVTVAKHSVQLQTGKDFWLDGIRVVNPLDIRDTNYKIAEDAYLQDGESEMISITLRQKLLTNAHEAQKTDENGDPVVNEDGDPIYELVWDAGFVVFTDSNGEIVSAEEYQSIGPKEEVYLNKGQKVSFSVITNDTTAYKLFLGMKAPFGSGKVQVGSKEYILGHAADCYYNVTDNRSIKKINDETYICTYTIIVTDSVVSLTNIKVTDAPYIELTAGEDDIVISGGSGENLGGN